MFAPLNAPAAVGPATLSPVATGHITRTPAARRRPRTQPSTFLSDAPIEASEPVPSAAKLLLLLEVFLGGPPSLGVSEIARDAGLTKSTAFRLLSVLTERGFLIRHGSRYSLGRRLIHFGAYTAYNRPHSLRDVATPILADMYSSYRATVHLGILDEGHVLYLEKLHGPSQMTVPSHVGSRLPATLTAVGKALLAFAPEEETSAVLKATLPRRTPYSITDPTVLAEELASVRAKGYAVDREESTVGLTCYGAPIIVAQRLVGAVSVCTSTSSSGEQLTAAVKRAAAEIGGALPRSSAELICAGPLESAEN